MAMSRKAVAPAPTTVERLYAIDGDALDSGGDAARAVTFTQVQPRGFIQGLARAARGRAMSAGIGFSVELPVNVPPLRADASMLRAVLLSALAQSIRVTPVGGRVAVACRYAGGSAATLAVESIDGPEQTAPRTTSIVSLSVPLA